MSKTGDKAILKLVEVLENLLKHFEEGKPGRSFDCDLEEGALFIKELQLLTTKPIIYVCNVDEESVITGNKHT